MNNTNRVLNRIFLFVVGVILLAGGAGAVGLAVVPEWSTTWKRSAPTINGTIVSALRNTAAVADRSWIFVAVPIGAVVLIVLLLVFIFRQGHGGTRALLTEREAASGTNLTDGSVVIDAAVAEEVIGDALARSGGLLSSNVSTYRVRGRAAMKITATARRGVSPKETQRFVEETVTAWDAVLGREVPVLVHINAGLRAKVTGATRTR